MLLRQTSPDLDKYYNINYKFTIYYDRYKHRKYKSTRYLGFDSAIDIKIAVKQMGYELRIIAAN